jgi:hypothetical protein
LAKLKSSVVYRKGDVIPSELRERVRQAHARATIGLANPGGRSSLAGCMDEQDSQYCGPPIDPGEFEFFRHDTWEVSDSWDSGEDSVTVQSIIVIGDRLECSAHLVVNVWGSSWLSCDEARELQGDIAIQASGLPDRVIGIIVDAVEQVIDDYFLVLPKCAVATTLNPIKTPDQDRTQDWRLAKDAVIVAFDSNFGSLSPGQRVDVKYPSGDVVRFIITSTAYAPLVQNRSVGLTPYLSGVPKAGTSPC